MKAPVVLLINREPNLEQLMTGLAGKKGFELRIARTSQEAFSVLSGQGAEIDLAVLDVEPFLHGSAVLEAAATRLPMIAVTSLEEAYARPLAQRHGAVACLGRPFPPEALERAVDVELEKIRATSAGKIATGNS